MAQGQQKTANGSGQQKEKRLGATDVKLARKGKKFRHSIKVHAGDFALLSCPHPYSVRPAGNRFLCGEQKNDETKSDGIFDSPAQLLNDECWNHLIGFCDAKDLARIVQTCRYLYVTGHQPELWRDLVLHQCNQRQQQDHGRVGDTIDIVGPTWKETYQKLCHGNLLIPRHIPIQSAGVSIYSDFLYRQHACRSFGLPDVWFHHHPCPTHQDVPRVSVEEVTIERFLGDFEDANRPVVITASRLANAAETFRSAWKAKFSRSHHASSSTHKQQNVRGRSYRATSGTAPLAANFTLDAYLDYCATSPGMLEEGPLYLFDRTALQQTNAEDDESPSLMLQKFVDELQRCCPFWNHEHNPSYDLFRLLGERRRPDHTWWIVGPPRSGSVFHVDPNATHAWNAVIMGRKRWLFYPPSASMPVATTSATASNDTIACCDELPPPGVYPSPNGDDVALPVSIGEWIFDFWDRHEERKKRRQQQQKVSVVTGTAHDAPSPMECTVGPGDVVFVPHGWWHSVINLEGEADEDDHDCRRNVCMAITHNYVGRSNLPDVFQFLNDKRDQVSGCRDRLESIKPDELYERFVDVLEEHHPDWSRQALLHVNGTVTGGDGAKAAEDTLRDNTTTKDKESIMSQAKGGVGDGGVFSFSFLPD